MIKFWQCRAAAANTTARVCHVIIVHVVCLLSGVSVQLSAVNSAVTVTVTGPNNLLQWVSKSVTIGIAGCHCGLSDRHRKASGKVILYYLSSKLEGSEIRTMLLRLRIGSYVHSTKS